MQSRELALVKYWRPTLLVLLPFAAGYWLSYFFRTINALLCEELIHELGMDASRLGLMTSVYFLTFAAVQLPLGVMLDRFGPRRVQSGLLLVAAIGALLFARADHFATFMLGRGLIGIGVAGALLAGLKAIVFWFPKERIWVVNGCFIMLGTLGAVSATSPAEWLLPYVGWRGLLELLAIATVAIASVIFLIVPDHAVPNTTRAPWVDLNKIYRDARFWRLAPLSTMCISSAWAIQGLWAAPWLADVEGLQRPAIVRHLLVMAVALSMGALLLGVGADQLRKRAFRSESILCCTALLFVAAESMLILGFQSSSYGPWAVIAATGAATVLSYSTLAEHFPKEIAGQANAALNIFHIGGAFAVQQSMGLIINQWPSHGGHYPSIAYTVALALLVALQIIAVIWFLRLGQTTSQSGVRKSIHRLSFRRCAATALDAIAAPPSWAKLPLRRRAHQ